MFWRKLLRIFENLRWSSRIFEDLRWSSRIFEDLRESSMIFENLWGSSRIFDDRQSFSVRKPKTLYIHMLLSRMIEDGKERVLLSEENLRGSSKFCWHRGRWNSIFRYHIYYLNHACFEVSFSVRKPKTLYIHMILYI